MGDFLFTAQSVPLILLLLKKCAAETSLSQKKKTYLFKKITKQDKETIEKRQTELVLGFEAQDRGGD